MKRREFISGLGLGAVAGLAACTRDAGTAGKAPAASAQTFRWKMVTTWPPNFPGTGTAALAIARTIEESSAGRIRIQVYADKELVPAFEVFDTVSRGSAEMGHGASYYWKGKSEAAQLFAAVPFGMNALEMNAWLYHGGGLELWRELYGGFNLIPAPGGNTGTQMGGWFNKEINGVGDLQGLKMRIPGLGGEVLRRAGGTPVSLPGADIFTSLQTGAIDATEWIGPYNDRAFGLHKAARYYYYPGWHEPCAALECMFNKDAFESLPEDLQSIVLAACGAANDTVLAEFTAHNAEALQDLVDNHGVELRRFPEAVLDHLQTLSREVLEEKAAGDETFGRIYNSYRKFLSQVAGWHRISEQAYLATREA